MALKGTLKDFGIADILQLIGQQQKTGQLVLKSKGDEVIVSFRDGNIVRAEAGARSKKELIGALLVRAGLISEQQLEFALETQKRTLRRLGDVLVGQGVLNADKFKEVVQLQTSETLYKLFDWKSGSYAFEQVDVEVDSAFSPLRAESVLMEGFRRVDEWPVVKKKLTTWEMTLDRVKELPPPPLEKDSFDVALDDAFDGATGERKESKSEFNSIGENERRVYGLVMPSRTVQTIIDLSCLGEFETAKAICNLINLDYLKTNTPAGRSVNDFERESGVNRLLGMGGRVLVTMLVVGALVFIGFRIDVGSLKLGASNATTYTDPAAQRFFSQQQMSRIQAALEVYRLEKGSLPMSLEELVNGGYLNADDVRYPWRDDYYYRRTEATAYVLLPPLH